MRARPLLVAVGSLALLVSAATVVGGCSAQARRSGTSQGEAITNPPLSFNAGSEASSGSIDLTNAYGLARLCTLAYDDSSQLPGELSDRGIDPTAGAYLAFVDDSTRTFAFYVEAQGAAFVVFRGTERNWQNITEDGDYFPSPEVVGAVHFGFQVATDAVWSGAGLADYVRQRQASGPSLPLYIAGHSLGAAMATIATARALLDGQRGLIAVAALYAYGSPRVGEAIFANELANAMSGAGTFFARVVNACDPVTNVPFRDGPPNFIPFYEHVSYGLDENDFVDWLSPDGSLQRSIPFAACAPAPFDVNQHMPLQYVTALAHQL